MRHPIPCELAPENIVVIKDTREWAMHQEDPNYDPLDVSPLAWEKGTLPFGDYSIKGLESVVSIERKTLSDMAKCIGKDRERFERELKVLRGYQYRAIVIEGTWDDIWNQNWPGDITPQQAFGSIMGWALEISVVMTGNHKQCGLMVARMLLLAARRRWRESRSLLAVLDEPTNTKGKEQ